MPDMLIFGVKLSTVTGERLPSESIVDEVELGHVAVMANGRDQRSARQAGGVGRAQLFPAPVPC